MRFDWDPAKRERTLAERGIDFADMPAMFTGPVLVTRSDRDGESRFFGLGAVNGRVMALVWTMRARETYWLISARAASRQERRHYADKAKPGG